MSAICGHSDTVDVIDIVNLQRLLATNEVLLHWLSVEEWIQRPCFLSFRLHLSPCKLNYIPPLLVSNHPGSVKPSVPQPIVLQTTSSRLKYLLGIPSIQPPFQCHLTTLHSSNATSSTAPSESSIFFTTTRSSTVWQLYTLLPPPEVHSWTRYTFLPPTTSNINCVATL